MPDFCKTIISDIGTSRKIAGYILQAGYIQLAGWRCSGCW